jgi:hypothetical protein
MKAYFCKLSIVAAFLLLPALTSLTYAQTTKTIKPGDTNRKSKIRIEVSEDENGEMKRIKKEYNVGPMSQEEKDKFVEKVLDSLGVDETKKQMVSITMDDGADDVLTKKRQKIIMDYRDDREPLALHWDKNFSYEFDSDKFRKQWRQFEGDFKPKARVFMKDMEDLGDRMGAIWDVNAPKAANVRGLNAYTNNPDNGMLNLRFSVPEKGDVTVTITDTKGKEVGKKEIKDFEGEFVGQVELKKNIKGTLFVTVVQNEDGAVKRVVIP